MTKKSIEQNIILYPPGCYGTFFEWVFNFLEDPALDTPFSDNGSSHKFQTGNFFDPKETLFAHVESDNRYKFSRVHLGLAEKINEHENCYADSYDKIIQKDLDYLKTNFDRVLVSIYDDSSILWFENNVLYKTFMSEDRYYQRYEKYGYTKSFLKKVMTRDPIQRVKHIIELEVESESSPLRVENLQGWGKDSIYDFDIWDLRELLSFYWFTRNQGELAAWDIVKRNNANSNVKFITINDLKHNFQNTILDAAEFFNVAIAKESSDKLDSIHKQWLKLQKHINRDDLCISIVDSIINNTPMDWAAEDLSIIDEAFIQKKLYDSNIEIKCDGLNVFPTNSQEFQDLLIRK